MGLGPVGLALATPLTVCLVVLAKYVPDLEIVSVLMSDEPVMGPARSYYQRLVARDESEAATLVQDYVASHPGQDVYDEVLVPALNHAQRDHGRGRITDVDARFVERTTRELIEELDLSEPPAEPALRPATSVLGLPAHEEADEIALQMLRQRLDPSRFTVDVASPDLLVSEAIAVVEARAPATVLIGALAGAGHPLHLRYLCKRLRARFPDLPIVVGWWGADGGDEAARDAMVAAGADRVTVSLADACAQLQELALLRRVPEPTAAAARSALTGARDFPGQCPSRQRCGGSHARAVHHVVMVSPARRHDYFEWDRRVRHRDMAAVETRPCAGHIESFVSDRFQVRGNGQLSCYSIPRDSANRVARSARAARPCQDRRHK